MGYFGSKSLERLDTCHADLITLFNAVGEEIDCTITCGHRNEEDQSKAVASGNSKAHFPHGKHNSNPSNAIDVCPYPVDWDDLDRFYWFGGWVLAKAKILRNVGEITHKIKWGGSWKGIIDGRIDFSYNRRDDVLDDLPHFELIPNE